jgi:hypothetical protein
MKVKKVILIFHHVIDIPLYFFFGEKMPCNIEHESPPCKPGVIRNGEFRQGNFFVDLPARRQHL